MSAESPRPARYSPCGHGLGRVPQVAAVPRRRAVEQREQALLPVAPSRGVRILLDALELDAEPIGQRLERLGEVQPLRLHHEGEHVALLLAAEAVVGPGRRAHVEGRRALVVKRAVAEVRVDALAPQVDAGADDLEHVRRLAHALTGVLREAAHGLNARGTQSSSKARIAKRSVIPAM